MSKKNKQLDRQKNLFELSIILPAFHFMYIQLKAAHAKHMEKYADDPQEFSKEFVVTSQIVRKVARVIKTYKQIQPEAIDISNAVMAKLPTNESRLNDFLLGVQLLDLHYNLRDKRLHIGIIDELFELCDFVFEKLDKDTIDRTIEIARTVYVNIVKYHEENLGYIEERKNIAFGDDELKVAM